MKYFYPKIPQKIVLFCLNIWIIIDLIFFYFQINYVQSSEYTAEDCKLLGFNTVNLMCSTCEKCSKYNLSEIE